MSEPTIEDRVDALESILESKVEELQKAYDNIRKRDDEITTLTEELSSTRKSLNASKGHYKQLAKRLSDVEKLRDAKIQKHRSVESSMEDQIAAANIRIRQLEEALEDDTMRIRRMEELRKKRASEGQDRIAKFDKAGKAGQYAWEYRLGNMMPRVMFSDASTQDAFCLEFQKRVGTTFKQGKMHLRRLSDEEAEQMRSGVI